MKTPEIRSARYAARVTRTTSAPAADRRPARSAAIGPSPMTRQRRPRTYRDTASAGRGDIMGYDRPTMKGRKRPFVEGEVKRKPAAEPAVIEPDEAADEVEAEPTDPDEGEVIDAVVESTPEAEHEPEPAAEEDEPKPRRGTGGLVKHDPLAAYMAEIRRIPLLSREEEQQLAEKYFETGDVAIARRLVTANLRLVVKIAHEYRRAYRNLLDLIQEGNIGLLQAMRKYDPFRGVKLSSYAAWWIRAYILKFILNNWRLVKIGTTQAQRKLFFNLRKEKEKLEQLGFRPEHKLLAERLDVTEDEVAEMERRLEGPDASLDAPLTREDAGGATRLDVMPASSETRPDVRAEND